MQIKIIESVILDGVHYVAGKIHDVENRVAKKLVQAEWAEPHKDPEPASAGSSGAASPEGGTGPAGAAGAAGAGAGKATAAS